MRRLRISSTALLIGIMMAIGCLCAPPSAYAVMYKSATSWSRTDIGWGWASSQIRHVINAGDLDENGYQDIMVVDQSGKLWWYPARDSRSFKARTQTGWGWGGMRQLLSGIDFDGDSYVDIVAIDYSGSLYLYPGKGNGTFAHRRLVGTGWGRVKNISISQVGFNGEPIIIGSHNSILKAWQTDGHGNFLNTIVYGNGWDTIALTAITGDVSGDGVPDMWAVSKSGELRLYVSQSSSGKSFKVYLAGTGWSSTKYFLPQADNARVVRSIFPDGKLRQYTLKSFAPTTQQYVPPKKPSLTGDAKLDAKLNSLKAKYPTLKSAYSYLVHNYRYIGAHGKGHPTGANWDVEYAKNFFANGGGNCYSFAAAYKWMARALGYSDATARLGYVGSNRSPHGWNEITINGTKYVFDADMDMSYLRSKGGWFFYHKTYAGQPIYYYDAHKRRL